jgi:hypothetical protein
MEGSEQERQLLEVLRDHHADAASEFRLLQHGPTVDLSTKKWRPEPPIDPTGQPNITTGLRTGGHTPQDRDERSEHNQGSEPCERADATGGGRYALQLRYWFLRS